MYVCVCVCVEGMCIVFNIKCFSVSSVCNIETLVVTGYYMYMQGFPTLAPNATVFFTLAASPRVELSSQLHVLLSYFLTQPAFKVITSQ
jgi:hypothetical protein